MNVKLSKIVNAVPALKELVAVTTSVRAAYKISKVLNALQEELTIFEDSKNRILKKYQSKNESGSLVVLPEDAELLQKELVELLDEEIEINVAPLAIKEINGVTDISVSNMMLVNFIFTDE